MEKRLCVIMLVRFALKSRQPVFACERSGRRDDACDRYLSIAPNLISSQQSHLSPHFLPTHTHPHTFSHLWAQLVNNEFGLDSAHIVARSSLSNLGCYHHTRGLLGICLTRASVWECWIRPKKSSWKRSANNLLVFFDLQRTSLVSLPIKYPPPLPFLPFFRIYLVRNTKVEDNKHHSRPHWTKAWWRKIKSPPSTDEKQLRLPQRRSSWSRLLQPNHPSRRSDW